MNKISNIGTLLKKIYRIYISELLSYLQKKGFADLRPSFLEVLLYVCEENGRSIRKIGEACGLKKQTMTSHLNELKKRGYVYSSPGKVDKREQNIFLTEYGEKFKFNLFESISEIEVSYFETLGEVEIDRMELMLQNFHTKLHS